MQFKFRNNSTINTNTIFSENIFHTDNIIGKSEENGNYLL